MITIFFHSYYQLYYYYLLVCFDLNGIYWHSNKPSHTLTDASGLLLFFILETLIIDLLYFSVVFFTV